MASARVDICNVALALLGQTAIRSTNEDNTRARLSSALFDFTRDYLLTKIDWAFARKYAKLQALDQDAHTVPEDRYVYGLPSDCHIVRDLAPQGSKDPWSVMGRYFYCKKSTDDDVYIYYTAKITEVALYSPAFNELLALGLAIKLCAPLTQDKKLFSALREQYMLEQNSAWETDTNIGSDYRAADEDPNNDSFVNPGGYTELEDYRE